MSNVNWEDLASIIVPAIVMMIPIVAILTSHQRKMAMILHGRTEEGRPVVAPDVQQVRQELNDLRQLVAQQSIAIDNIASSQTQILQKLGSSPEIQQRVES